MQRIGMAALAALALAGCQKSVSSKAEVRASPGGQRAGLWEQTVSAEGRRQTTQVCVGAGGTVAFSQVVSAGAKDCGQLKISGAAHGLDFDQTCDLGPGGRQAAHGEMLGDLAKGYRMVLTTTVTGAAAPEANGVRSSIVDALWKGPCPAGLKPGQMRLPDGTVVGK